MLSLAAGVLGVTAVAGLGLFALYGRIPASGPVWWPGAVHGAAGLLGAALLLAGLGGPPRGVAEGAGAFGRAAVWLIGGAVLLGLTAASGRLRRRAPSALVLGVHATLAVAGVVMLVAYVGAGD
jgi:hypothetical protein